MPGYKLEKRKLNNDPASDICCGGWWYKVNCTSAQDSNLRIHWSRLDSSDAGKSAPTTTETKIRPSRGFRSRRSLAYVKTEDLDSFFPSLTSCY
ncbi:hypothetical protein pdam_00012278 [Pocillopora damicornis]|uniref:Uncharacterized protein n=1 Tax=Pocillopora damicornis TaxID=46731 RepID=A0A3M6T9E7_POCDA|nr:hypothetical protein pdam_00012278 [Pocillopora damicornis]